MTFAERLRELRDAVGLSEAKLAATSGVSFGALHDYGLGRRKPSFAAAVKIAKALGATCQAFADCDDILNAEEEAAEPARPRGRPRKPAPETPPATSKAKGKRKES